MESGPVPRAVSTPRVPTSLGPPTRGLPPSVFLLMVGSRASSAGTKAVGVGVKDQSIVDFKNAPKWDRHLKKV